MKEKLRFIFLCVIVILTCLGILYFLGDIFQEIVNKIIYPIIIISIIGIIISLLSLIIKSKWFRKIRKWFK